MVISYEQAPHLHSPDEYGEFFFSRKLLDAEQERIHPDSERERERPPKEEEKEKPPKEKEKDKTKEKKKEKQKEKQRQRVETREATGLYKAIPIHCDICGNNLWSVSKKFRMGNMIVINVDCINGRMGAIAVEEPADISTEAFGFSPIVVTCGKCGKSDKFKPLGKVPVMYPGRGEQSVKIECSCGKKYTLKTYDKKLMNL